MHYDAVDMLEMFEKENWSFEKRKKHVLQKIFTIMAKNVKKP